MFPRGHVKPETKSSSSSSTRCHNNPIHQSSQQLGGALNDDDKEKLVADLVFYLLAQEQKHGIHRKTDMLKAVGLTGKSRELQEKTLNAAVRKLQYVFGIDCRDVPEKKGHYILINRIRQAEDAIHIQLSKNEKAHMGLLYAILGLIFMNNGVVRDDVLNGFLIKLGVLENPEGVDQTSQQQSVGDVRQDVRQVFGDVKSLIKNEWVQKQRYIEMIKVDGGDIDSPIFEYRWGIRANVEVIKSELLQFTCNLYNCQPTFFKTQYDAVIQEEGEDVFGSEDP